MAQSVAQVRWLVGGTERAARTEYSAPPARLVLEWMEPLLSVPMSSPLAREESATIIGFGTFIAWTSRRNTGDRSGGRRCAKMCAVVARSAEVTDGMNRYDHHVSRRRYARLRSTRIASASDPLSVATVQEPSLCAMTVEVDPPPHGPAAPTATPNEPFRTFLAGMRRGDFPDLSNVRTTTQSTLRHWPPAARSDLRQRHWN